MWRSAARSVEVWKLRIRVPRHVLGSSQREESVVGTIGCSNVRLKTHLWSGQRIIVGIEVNCYRAWRGKIFRKVWPEHRIRGHAICTGCGTVTEGHGAQVIIVLGRAHAAGPVAEKDIFQLGSRICR